MLRSQRLILAVEVDLLLEKQMALVNAWNQADIHSICFHSQMVYHWMETVIVLDGTKLKPVKSVDAEQTEHTQKAPVPIAPSCLWPHGHQECPAQPLGDAVPVHVPLGVLETYHLDGSGSCCVRGV